MAFEMKKGNSFPLSFLPTLPHKNLTVYTKQESSGGEKWEGPEAAGGGVGARGWGAPLQIKASGILSCILCA